MTHNPLDREMTMPCTARRIPAFTPGTLLRPNQTTSIDPVPSNRVAVKEPGPVGAGKVTERKTPNSDTLFRSVTSQTLETSCESVVCGSGDVFCKGFTANTRLIAHANLELTESE